MFDFNLPLDYHFIKILSNYEIINWEAKKFWSKFEISESYNRFRLCQSTYMGIKILTKHGYLSVMPSPMNKKVFLYSETEKLKEFRMQFFKKNYEQIFISHKKEISKRLEFLNLQNEFSKELISSYPGLTLEIKKYQHNIENGIKNCEAKILTLNDLIKII